MKEGKKKLLGETAKKRKLWHSQKVKNWPPERGKRRKDWKKEIGKERRKEEIIGGTPKKGSCDTLRNWRTDLRKEGRKEEIIRGNPKNEVMSRSESKGPPPPILFYILRCECVLCAWKHDRNPPHNLEMHEEGLLLQKEKHLRVNFRFIYKSQVITSRWSMSCKSSIYDQWVQSLLRFNGLLNGPSAAARSSLELSSVYPAPLNFCLIFLRLHISSLVCLYGAPETRW